jgi:fused signal recognition particle receptor
MGFFDFFKKKKTEDNVPQPQTSSTNVEASHDVVGSIKLKEEIANLTNQPTEEKEEVLAVENQKAIEEGVKKTKENFFSKIGKALIGKSSVDADFLDDLEDALVSADVGVATTVKIIERLEKKVSKDKYLNTNELNKILREEITALLSENNQQKIPGFDLPKAGEPYVIMVVGVNGVGKTTTIGKLSYQFKDRGNSVVMGAADTFRAAAVDQLTIWSKRVDVPIVSRGMNADPAAVAFDTVQSAKSKGYDVAIIDTAGRLHNKIGLMNELTKIKNSISKVIDGAPHEVLLVLDASTGQNAIEQAKQFTAATNVNAIALTKLDGTAKGGVVIAIADQFKIPIKYIGVGEQMKDLRLFDKEAFIQSLFSDI